MDYNPPGRNKIEHNEFGTFITLYSEKDSKWVRRQCSKVENGRYTPELKQGEIVVETVCAEMIII